MSSAMVAAGPATAAPVMSRAPYEPSTSVPLDSTVHRPPVRIQPHRPVVVAFTAGAYAAIRAHWITFGPAAPRALCARVCAPAAVVAVGVSITIQGGAQGYQCTCGGDPGGGH